jgi:hypothetical protein
MSQTAHHITTIIDQSISQPINTMMYKHMMEYNAYFNKKTGTGGNMKHNINKPNVHNALIISLTIIAG